MTETRWYATRSGLNARTDEDRAMAYEQLGPFGSQELARVALAIHFRDGVRRVLEPRNQIDSDFGPQYLDLLTAIATHPRDDAWTVAGVRWRLWRARQEEPDTCGQAWVAEIELCPRCGRDSSAHAAAGDNDRETGAAVVPLPTKVTVALNASDLSAAMREALLTASEDTNGAWFLDTMVRTGTVVALIRRGLAGTGATNYLTKSGERVREHLLKLAQAEGARDIGTPNPRPAGWQDDPRDREEPAEVITVTVPRALAEAVEAAWAEAYRRGEDRQAERYQALAEAYSALRAEVMSNKHGWLSRALLDAAYDAEGRAASFREG